MSEPAKTNTVVVKMEMVEHDTVDPSTTAAPAATSTAIMNDKEDEEKRCKMYDCELEMYKILYNTINSQSSSLLISKTLRAILQFSMNRIYWKQQRKQIEHVRNNDLFFPDLNEDDDKEPEDDAFSSNHHQSSSTSNSNPNSANNIASIDEKKKVFENIWTSLHGCATNLLDVKKKDENVSGILQESADFLLNEDDADIIMSDNNKKKSMRCQLLSVLDVKKKSHQQQNQTRAAPQARPPSPPSHPSSQYKTEDILDMLREIILESRKFTETMAIHFSNFNYLSVLCPFKIDEYCSDNDSNSSSSSTGKLHKKYHNYFLSFAWMLNVVLMMQDYRDAVILKKEEEHPDENVTLAASFAIFSPKEIISMRNRKRTEETKNRTNSGSNKKLKPSEEEQEVSVISEQTVIEALTGLKNSSTPRPIEVNSNPQAKVNPKPIEVNSNPQVKVKKGEQSVIKILATEIDVSEEDIENEVERIITFLKNVFLPLVRKNSTNDSASEDNNTNSKKRSAPEEGTDDELEEEHFNIYKILAEESTQETVMTVINHLYKSFFRDIFISKDLVTNDPDEHERGEKYYYKPFIPILGAMTVNQTRLSQVTERTELMEKLMTHPVADSASNDSSESKEGVESIMDSSSLGKKLKLCQRQKLVDETARANLQTFINRYELDEHPLETYITDQDNLQSFYIQNNHSHLESVQQAQQAFHSWVNNCLHDKNNAKPSRRLCHIIEQSDGKDKTIWKNMTQILNQTMNRFLNHLNGANNNSSAGSSRTTPLISESTAEMSEIYAKTSARALMAPHKFFTHLEPRRYPTLQQARLMHGVLALYYHALERDILLENTRGLPSTEKQKQQNNSHLANVIYHRSLLSVCLRVVGVVNKIEGLDSSSIFRITGTNLLESFNMMEIFLRAMTDTHPGYLQDGGMLEHNLTITNNTTSDTAKLVPIPNALAQYLLDFESRVVAVEMWASSDIFSYANDFYNSGTRLQRRFYHHRTNGDSLQRKPFDTFFDLIANEGGKSPLWPVDCIKYNPNIDEEDGDHGCDPSSLTSPDSVQKMRNLDYIFRKALCLLAERLWSLVKRLQIELLANKIWVALRYCLRNHIDLLRNRHMDQILLPTIYIVCKAVGDSPEDQVSFGEMYKVFEKEIPLVNSNVIAYNVMHNVYIGVDNLQNADIIKFYNEVYIKKTSMRDFLMRFKEVSNRKDVNKDMAITRELKSYAGIPLIEPNKNMRSSISISYFNEANERKKKNKDRTQIPFKMTADTCQLTIQTRDKKTLKKFTGQTRRIVLQNHQQLPQQQQPRQQQANSTVIRL